MSDVDSNYLEWKRLTSSPHNMGPGEAFAAMRSSGSHFVNNFTGPAYHMYGDFLDGVRRRSHPHNFPKIFVEESAFRDKHNAFAVPSEVFAKTGYAAYPESYFARRVRGMDTSEFSRDGANYIDRLTAPEEPHVEREAASFPAAVGSFEAVHADLHKARQVPTTKPRKPTAKSVRKNILKKLMKKSKF